MASGPTTPPAERMRRANSASSAASTARMVARAISLELGEQVGHRGSARLATWRSLYESFPPRMVRVGGSSAGAAGARAMSISRG